MKYCSIDIETAGLNQDCSLLEFGAVLDDLENPKPIDTLPVFHTYIINDKIVGEPYALAMHQVILDRISKSEKPWTYLYPGLLDEEFCKFLEGNGYEYKDFKITINVAGKNYAMFDKMWLEDLLNSIKVYHRVIDPSILYYRIGDKNLPGLQECINRSGIQEEVLHTAVDDAKMVVKLLRKHFLK